MRAGSGASATPPWRCLSLFSGLGGFDLAFERAGMEIVGQVEIDKECRRVLAKHWPDVWRAEDVRSVGLGRATDHVEGQPLDAEGDHRDAERRWLDVDLVCGGVPCQPFSVAGRREGEADERNLWPEFFRIVREVRPRWFVAENVPGILSIAGSSFGGQNGARASCSSYANSDCARRCGAVTRDVLGIRCRQHRIPAHRG